MSNEKLAESLRKLADDWHDALPEITASDCIQELRDEIEAHAAEAAQAQAQSGSLDELLIERGSATRDVRDNRILAFVTANQAQTLLDAFGGSSAIYALIHCERGQCAPRDDGSESPEGLYVYDINYQEEGVIYLGDEDEESEPREEVPQPQPAQDAALYQELLMAVSKKFPNESRHETALRYIKQTELQSCEPKCDAAMAKESGR